MRSEPLQEGALLNDRYRIVRVLGQGGMGTVYLAEHTRLDKLVAVKEVSGVLSNTAELREALNRCEQEGRLLVNLHHPNLPQVLDAFVESDRFYLVMEYLEGVTLEDKLAEHHDAPLDVTLVVSYGKQMAAVLSYLHKQQPPIIFRDLKPANVMALTDGTIKLIDFGIARRFQKGARSDTEYLGSIGYSPPEQFGERQTDTRSDIYAFGATLHHLLTGRHPTTRPFEFIPAKSLNGNVPESLSHLIERCVAVEAKSRPATMEEVARSLETIGTELATAKSRSAYATSPISTGTSGMAAKPNYTAPALVIALAVGILGYIGYSKLNEPAPAKQAVQPPVVVGTPEGEQEKPKPPPPEKQKQPPQATAGLVAVHKDPVINAPLEYWFEGSQSPEFDPQPLEIFDEKGVATLNVPLNFVTAEAHVCVRNRDNGQVIRWSLAELVKRKKQNDVSARNQPNLVPNGRFQEKDRFWHLSAQNLPAQLAYRSHGSIGSHGEITLGMPKAKESFAHLIHNSVYLKENSTYRLQFRARSDTAREIGVVSRLSTVDGGLTGLDSRVALSEQWRRFEIPFMVTVAVSQRQKREVVFRFTPPKEVKKVSLAGSFNGWNLNANPMSRLPDGKTWQTSRAMDAGEYEYKFWADGEWLNDPGKPTRNDRDGNINSLINVSLPPVLNWLSFTCRPPAGRIEITDVSIIAEEDPAKRPLPQIEVTLKPADLAPKPEKSKTTKVSGESA